MQVDTATRCEIIKPSNEKPNKLRSSKLLSTWEPSKSGWRNMTKDGHGNEQKSINFHTMNLTYRIDQQK